MNILERPSRAGLLLSPEFPAAPRVSPSGNICLCLLPQSLTLRKSSSQQESPPVPQGPLSHKYPSSTTLITNPTFPFSFIYFLLLSFPHPYHVVSGDNCHRRPILEAQKATVALKNLLTFPVSGESGFPAGSLIPNTSAPSSWLSNGFVKG